jgi:PilZ domain-containing protein
MIDRRIEPRLMCADIVEVEWKDELGQPRKCTGLLEDISPQGACLQLDDPLPLDTDLDIEYHKGRLKGSVSYCYFSEIGYWVGVRFGSDMTWSLKRFRPKHMLDLKKLANGKPQPNKRKPAQ